MTHPARPCATCPDFGALVGYRVDEPSKTASEASSDTPSGVATPDPLVQPEPDFGTLVGFRVHTPSPGIAVLDLPLRPYHRNRLGTVHGGVIMTLLDTAGMWACSEEGQLPGCPTVSINCSFVRAVAPSKVASLNARAEVVRRGRRMHFVNITAFAGSDVVATAQGVYAVRQTATS